MDEYGIEVIKLHNLYRLYKNIENYLTFNIDLTLLKKVDLIYTKNGINLYILLFL